MVPCRHRQVVSIVCFPRASGDGPSNHKKEEQVKKFPPRERGWSRLQHRHEIPRPVSPARAGMVPKPCPTKPSTPSFPRASGDGPDIKPVKFGTATFPPRERGWSLPGLLPHRMRVVSPARAGMVLEHRFVLFRLAGFPRASGDGPRSTTSSRWMGRFPPRERGWSRARAAAEPAGRVSPARAEMVLKMSVINPASSSFPRASGDGPHRRRQPCLSGKFPPRERGWSHGFSQCITTLFVSPARAGMVPSKAPAD